MWWRNRRRQLDGVRIRLGEDQYRPRRERVEVDRPGEIRHVGDPRDVVLRRRGDQPTHPRGDRVMCSPVIWIEGIKSRNVSREEERYESLFFRNDQPFGMYGRGNGRFGEFGQANQNAGWNQQYGGGAYPLMNSPMMFAGQNKLIPPNQLMQGSQMIMRTGQMIQPNPALIPAAMGASIQPTMVAQPAVAPAAPATPAPRRTYACYGCGNTGHLLKDCPTLVAATAAQVPK